MENRKFLTKKEFCNQIGMSRSAFYRNAEECEIALSRKLLTPDEQDYIIKAFQAKMHRDLHGDKNLKQEETS